MAQTKDLDSSFNKYFVKSKGIKEHSPYLNKSEDDPSKKVWKVIDKIKRPTMNFLSIKNPKALNQTQIKRSQYEEPSAYEDQPSKLDQNVRKAYYRVSSSDSKGDDLYNFTRRSNDISYSPITSTFFYTLMYPSRKKIY